MIKPLNNNLTMLDYNSIRDPLKGYLMSLAQVAFFCVVSKIHLYGDAYVRY